MPWVVAGFVGGAGGGALAWALGAGPPIQVAAGLLGNAAVLLIAEAM